MCTCTFSNCAVVSHRVVCPVLSVSPIWRVVGPSGRCRPGVSCGSVVVCPHAHGFVRSATPDNWSVFVPSHALSSLAGVSNMGLGPHPHPPPPLGGAPGWRPGTYQGGGELALQTKLETAALPALGQSTPYNPATMHMYTPTPTHTHKHTHTHTNKPRHTYLQAYLIGRSYQNVLRTISIKLAERKRHTLPNPNPKRRGRKEEGSRSDLCGRGGVCGGANIIVCVCVCAEKEGETSISVKHPGGGPLSSGRQLPPQLTVGRRPLGGGGGGQGGANGGGGSRRGKWGGGSRRGEWGGGLGGGNGGGSRRGEWGGSRRGLGGGSGRVGWGGGGRWGELGWGGWGTGSPPPPCPPSNHIITINLTLTFGAN